MNADLSANFSSILDRTIIEILKLDSMRTEDIIEWAEDFLLSEVLVFSEQEWLCLNSIRIYASDSLSTPLSFTMRYFMPGVNSEIFDKLIIGLMKIIESTFNIGIKPLKQITSRRNALSYGFRLLTLQSFPLKESYLPEPARDFLSKHPHMAIHDIFSLTEYQIVKSSGFNYDTLLFLESLEKIPQIYRNESENMSAFFERPKAWKSFDSVIYHWIMPALDYNKKFFEIVNMRLFSAYKPCSLQKIGDQHGFSRERARQIIKSVSLKITNQDNLSRIAPLYEALYATADKYKVVSLEKACSCVNTILGWSLENGIRPKALKSIISLTPALSLDICECTVNKVYMILSPDFPCRKCPQTTPILKKIIKKQISISSEDLAKLFHKICMNNCIHCRNIVHSGSFCVYIYLQNKRSLSSVIFRDQMFYAKDAYIIYRASIKKTIDYILKKRKTPMSIREIYNQILKYKKRPLSYTKVRNTVYVSKDYLTWDRGKYIHIEKIDLNQLFCNKLIELIESHNKEQFMKKGKILSVKELFQIFSEKCLEAGIPNHYALYSCLKQKTNSSFKYLLFPTIIYNGEQS